MLPVWRVYNGVRYVCIPYYHGHLLSESQPATEMNVWVDDNDELLNLTKQGYLPPWSQEMTSTNRVSLATL